MTAHTFDAISPTAPLQDGAHDFDFLHGRWHVRNRRLRTRLVGCDEWDEFDGSSVVSTLWNGRANYEEWEANAPAGLIRAVSLHLYDPASRQWRLHWVTSGDGVLGAPMIGSFSDGVGEFYNAELFDGRAVFVRIHWRDRGGGRVDWDQAYSADGGRSWETNWTMEFTRTA